MQSSVFLQKMKFRKEMFVIEYLGVVTSNKEVGSGKAYYVMLDGDLLLDGATCGSLASFVNHSCTPNCSLQIWMVPVSAGKYEPRVGIFSLELIGKGVPLTIDYQMMSIVPFTSQCLCGSTVCKKYINKNDMLSTRKSAHSKQGQGRVLQPEMLSQNLIWWICFYRMILNEHWTCYIRMFS